jgi:hypothetical protein
MSTQLNEYKIDAGNYKRLDGAGGENQSWRNTTGTPITSVTPNAEGNLVAGIYNISFATGSVVPGVSATALIGCSDPKNPNINTSPGVTVNLDGSTPNKNVIRGLDVVFSSSGSFNESWAGKVYTGAYYDATSGEVRVTAFGTQDAGQTSAGQRIALRNDGSTIGIDCSVKIVNKARYQHTNGTPFVKTYQLQLNPTADADLLGKAVAFANYTAGSPPTIDMTVGGVSYDLVNLNTGTTYPGGAALPIDGVTLLKFADGTKYQGVVIVLSTTIMDNTPTATIYVSDGAQFVEIAPDVSGAPGTYVAGTAGLTLTEDGGSNPGEIGPGSTAFYWQRFKSGGSATPDLNIRLWAAVYVAKGV